MRRILIIFLISCSLTAGAQSTLSFRSLNEVFVYADAHSVTFKNATQQVLMNKYQTLAAKLDRWKLKGDANLTSTDNTKLGVTFIPAEIFGGPAGTYRQVTFGQQYVTSANFAPQIDILNPFSMAQVRTARASEQVTNATNLLNKKSLYESVAGAYYNILSYQWQIKVTKNSLDNADTLTAIMVNKQQEGIARQQDVNNAKANQLSIQDKLQQLEVNLEEQYSSLKLLCDMDPNTPITIEETADQGNFDASLTATGYLTQLQSEWQLKYQEADLRANKRWFLPTVTLFSSLGWQQNTNNHPFDGSRWINSSYVGVKVAIPILPDVGKVAAVRYDRINVAVAKNNFEHAARQDSVNNQQLQLEYQKAFKSARLAGEIAALKEDSYYKNLNIYKEGILSATDLFTAFNDWLNNSLNAVSQQANSDYAKSKIMINNIVK
ncbi:MAG: putative outer rane efflux protein precursor [Bacteroidetes bacterium]|uniref:TolC family protein n=1 Tax=Chitinophaga sp. LS1 TaxID=3051176 RepID=UPI001DE683A3|nr:TolC family protein [Chitinophaga sp. LS1]MBP1650874.1 putative outer rane efflux protein precursor [Bacteroidota bacterium]WPV70412.1 TolC family protein [Chitinophaga sp. LS1]